MMALQIMRLANGENLPLPAYESPGAAGMDLRAAEDTVLKPGARFLMPTGFAIALPDHHEAQVRPRSGLAVKHGITVLNSPGTIDSDYRGEIKVIAINLGQEPITIVDQERIAQLVVCPIVQADVEEASDLNESGRGSGGFGSTGV